MCFLIINTINIDLSLYSCDFFQQKLENGCPLNDVSVIDIAALIKQYFRELPDSLLSSYLHDTFLKCTNLECPTKQKDSILDLCLLLPSSYLSTLRFTLLFLSKVAEASHANRMDAYNLAVCMAPSCMWVIRKGDKISSKDIDEKHMQKVAVVQILINNAQLVGMVDTSLSDQANLWWASEDELEKSDAHDESKSKKKKRRSGSLQGLLRKSNTTSS